jgi:MarR family transcriptional regulator, transcriptional regulator for hemolysin
MDALDERFSAALHNTARAWRLAVDRRLKYLGVSQASWMTIATIAGAGSSLSQSEIADRLGVEGATIVSMVDRLVKSGFAIREPSKTDRRVKRVLLTDAGNTLYTRVKREADAVRQHLLANVDRIKLRHAAEVLEELRTILETPG